MAWRHRHIVASSGSDSLARAQLASLAPRALASLG